MGTRLTDPINLRVYLGPLVRPSKVVEGLGGVLCTLYYLSFSVHFGVQKLPVYYIFKIVLRWVVL